MASSSFDLYLSDGKAHQKRGHFTNARRCYRWARDVATTTDEQTRAKRLISECTEKIGDNPKY